MGFVLVIVGQYRHCVMGQPEIYLRWQCGNANFHNYHDWWWLKFGTHENGDGDGLLGFPHHTNLFQIIWLEYIQHSSLDMDTTNNN